MMFIIPFSLAQTSSNTDKNPCMPCEELKNIMLPDVIVSEVTQWEEPVAYCRVVGVIGKEINFEFLLPGVLHCGGGPGPSQADWIELVRNWVEKGIAPDRVVLSKTVDEKISLTRPVFPYPYKAVYNGKGDINKESSFNKSTTTNKK